MSTTTDAAAMGHVIRIVIVGPLEKPGRKFLAKCKCKWKAERARYDRPTARKDGTEHILNALKGGK